MKNQVSRRRIYYAWLYVSAPVIAYGICVYFVLSSERVLAKSIALTILSLMSGLVTIFLLNVAIEIDVYRRAKRNLEKVESGGPIPDGTNQ